MNPQRVRDKFIIYFALAVVFAVFGSFEDIARGPNQTLARAGLMYRGARDNGEISLSAARR